MRIADWISNLQVHCGGIIAAWFILCARQSKLALLLLIALAGASTLPGEPYNYFLFGLTLVLSGVWVGAKILPRFTERGRAFIQSASVEAKFESRTTGVPAIDNLIEEANQSAALLLTELDCVKSSQADADERFRILTDNLAAAVIIRDLTGRILYCSPYTEVLTGYSQNHIRSVSHDFLLSIIHPQDRELYMRAFKVCECGEPFQFRYRFIHQKGLEMWAETRAVPLLGDDDEVISTLSVTFDVTATVRYQRQVEEKNRDLQDFTSMVSHDLKAPIATIKGMLGLINEDYAGKFEPDVVDNFDHISRAAGRLEQLVSGVLEYAKISVQEIGLEPVSLKEPISEVLTDFTQQIKSAGAHVEVSQHLPHVWADALGLYQIFANLIGNALKYKDSGRPLEIYIENLKSEVASVVRLAVRDNGSGIPEALQSKIFRPFQRAHGPDIEGSGIGLASVKRLLERFGGSIELESQQGLGSTFILTFRLAQESAVKSDLSDAR